MADIFTNDATRVQPNIPASIRQSNFIVSFKRDQDYKRLQSKYPNLSNKSYEYLKVLEESQNKPKASLQSNTDSKEQQKIKQNRFKQNERIQEITNNIDNYESTIAPVIRMVPFLGSLMDAGQSQVYKEIGNSQQARQLGNQATISSILDLGTTGAGLAAIREIGKGMRSPLIGYKMSRVTTSPSTSQVSSKIIDYQPVTHKAERTRYPFWERPSMLTSEEKAGLSRHDRTNKVPYLQGSVSSVPEDIVLINRANAPYQFKNGVLEWNYIPSGVPNGRRITHHFTLDKPVTGNAGGDWSLSTNTMIVPYNHVVSRNGQPIGASVMDTYFGGFGRFTLDKDKVKILTSNPDEYRRYRLQGVSSEYSPESAKIIEQANQLKSKLEPLKQRLYGEGTPLSDDEFSLLQNLENQLTELGDRNYDIVNNWISKNSRKPTIQDFQLIEQESGLPTGARLDSYGNIQYHSTPTTHFFDFITNIESQKKINQFNDDLQGIIAPQRKALYEQAKKRYPNLFKPGGKINEQD